MTKDNETEPSEEEASLRRVLTQLPFAREVVARELRLMAAGQEPYRRFTYIPASVKSIWRAAADILDPLQE